MCCSRGILLIVATSDHSTYYPRSSCTSSLVLEVRGIQNVKTRVKLWIAPKITNKQQVQGLSIGKGRRAAVEREIPSLLLIYHEKVLPEGILRRIFEITPCPQLNSILLTKLLPPSAVSCDWVVEEFLGYIWWPRAKGRQLSVDWREWLNNETPTK